MLRTFDGCMAGMTTARLTAFAGDWLHFHTCFEEWKARDTQKLLDAMFEHFMQLERLWDSVRGQVNAEIEWKPRIEAQQKSIKAKVLRIGGKSALQHFEAGQKEFRDLSDSSDNEVMSSTQSPAGPRKRNDSVAKGLESEVAAPAAGTSSELNDVLSGFGVSNEMLAHELIMDPGFELKPQKTGLEAQVHAMAKKAFFDKVREDMSTPGASMMWALGVLADVRQVGDGHLFSHLIIVATSGDGSRKEQDPPRDRRRVGHGTYRAASQEWCLRPA